MQINKITSPIAKLMLIDDMGYKKAEMPVKNRPYCIFEVQNMSYTDLYIDNSGSHNAF